MNQHPYLEAFQEDAPFLYSYQIASDGRLQATHWSRKRFLTEAHAAALHLTKAGLGVGDRQLHCFAANHPMDLVFRLAAVLIGSVPVTVNWQADDEERIAYKAKLANAKAVIVDPAFPEPLLQHLDPERPRIPAIPSGSEACAIKPVAVSETSERLVIFTSGTTGNPKGVLHLERSYRTNKATFEDFLEPTPRWSLLVANPLHHANASATCDWAMRTPGARVHLLPRYTSDYWRLMVDLANAEPQTPLIAPLTARHFDFLANLEDQKRLPRPLPEMRNALNRVILLMGSAPVGPTTTERVQHFTGKTPTVRFGSSETCLQVAGIPPQWPADTVVHAFKQGWDHPSGAGYLIGSPHRGHTDLQIVRATDPNDPGFMEPCPPGTPGLMITQGNNLMQNYLGDPQATEVVMHNGWYLGLQDVGFYLEQQGRRLFYWQSRRSNLLIRGGANYAYAQLEHDIAKALSAAFPELDFDLAVVAVKLHSEHEDDLCLTLETDKDQATRGTVASFLLDPASLPKHARPQRLHFGPIPRNFKGAIQTSHLTAYFVQDKSESKNPH